jgi:hypothetical protein
MSAGASQMTSGGRSKQHSESGIAGKYRYELSDRTYNTDQQVQESTDEAARSPFGYYKGQHVNDLVPTNEWGLPVETTNFMNHAWNQQYKTASAGGAMRGQVQPEATPGIIGSAMTNMGAQMMPYVMDFKKYMVDLPNKLYQDKLSYYQGLQGTRAGMLGSRSDANAWNYAQSASAHVSAK